MQMPIALPPLPSAQPWVARLWARVVAAASGRTRAPQYARVHAEDEALAGLSEHMLKDIGASSRLCARAAERAREARAMRDDPAWW